MIEGLRSLPWLQERIRNDLVNVKYLTDCELCMAIPHHTRQHRQALGCGWESPVDGARPYMHEGYTDTPPTTCPGYTTKLPEVIEINRLRLHWSKFGGFKEREPTEVVKRGIEILEGAVNEANCWKPEKP